MKKSLPDMQDDYRAKTEILEGYWNEE
jgi:hypothetical protein